MNKQDRQTGDVLTARVRYDESDGGWEGVIHMSRFGHPGEENVTDSVCANKSDAIKATEKLCDRVWPNHEPIWKSDHE